MLMRLWIDGLHVGGQMNEIICSDEALVDLGV